MIKQPRIDEHATRAYKILLAGPSFTRLIKYTNGNEQVVVWCVLYFSFFVVCLFCFYVNILTVLRNRNKWNKLKNSLVFRSESGNLVEKIS